MRLELPDKQRLYSVLIRVPVPKLVHPVLVFNPQRNMIIWTPAKLGLGKQP